MARLGDEGASLLVVADKSSNPEEVIAQGCVAYLVHVVAAAYIATSDCGIHGVCELVCVYHGNHDKE